MLLIIEIYTHAIGNNRVTKNTIEFVYEKILNPEEKNSQNVMTESMLLLREQTNTIILETLTMKFEF